MTRQAFSTHEFKRALGSLRRAANKGRTSDVARLEAHIDRLLAPSRNGGRRRRRIVNADRERF